MARVKQSGIYAIENTINGRCYFGSTVDRASRWNEHRRRLRAGKHTNVHLQHAWTVYGENAFRFVWMQDVPTEQLLDVEQEYLDTFGDSYNIAKCAEAFRRGLKMPHSPEHRRKIGAAHVGMKRSAEARANMSAAQLKIAEQTRARLTGKPRPLEVVAKIAAKLQGRKLPPRSPEHSRKISEALQRRYHPERFVA